MPNRPLLGELIVNKKLASQDAIDQALKLQTGGNRRLGHILVRMKAITDDQLADTLAGQLNKSITKEQESFTTEAKKTIPRYLCTHYGVLPLRYYVKKVHEGTVSITADLILYHNNDLTVAIDKKGSYSLQGHGGFADGLYKAEFSDQTNLKSFIQQHEKDLSGAQIDWQQWALRQEGKGKAKQLVAKN